jgi:Tfp pilus tip-associated adhesin PilY1
VAPDALIVLDLSGSMDYNPAGGSNIYGDSTCAGPFYSSSGTGHRTDCSRVAIARRAVFDVLDDNGDGTINSADESTLNIRFGYMRFRGGNDTGGDYNNGNIKLSWTIGSRYSRIYCNNATSCALDSSASGSISGDTPDSGTPLASALNEAKIYLDENKAADNAGACRQKFVILISDGADTYACSGNGTETQSDQYKRRRESVAKAKALADAGYKVFVVGFGSAMPDYLERTLNWMAYHGGTDNPMTANSGNTAAYNPPATSCANASTSGSCPQCYATSNDPGNTPLSGYAFLASNAQELSDALKATINIIRQANYSFSQASVQSSRTMDENYLYEGSFQPVNNEAFWLGHLKKYNIGADGSVGSEVWDAGTILQSRTASSRNIKTYKNGALVDFTTTYIAAADLGVATDAERDAVVGFIRGDSTYNSENWKLGDVFRSTPVTVGSPSAFFFDSRDANAAFAAHRAAHPRTSANGQRLVLAGANDGQLHAFLTSTGGEAWSFIPPNLLTKLRNISHSEHPTGLTHQYFVDGPVTVADVWLGSGSGTGKSSSDWKTFMVFGEGRGGTGYLWSSSTSCDTGMNATYSTTFSYYCGYYAFDLTNSLAPAYMWRLSPGATEAPYIGEPWGKVMVGKVKISGDEKWVGFVGAGYNAADCSGGEGCDNRGKGFLVVDLSNGSVLWSYTHASNGEMDYSLAASCAVVDTDNDGFIDTVYVGDLGGTVWRFKFCTAADGASCSSSNWSGGRLFRASAGVIRPIYTTPSVAKDGAGSLWVYWGTGDKTDPTASNVQEKFFGVRDNNRTTTWSLGDLEDITSGIFDPDSSTRAGWYINLAGSGEKILADSVVFGGVVYFTTYVPPSGDDPCSQAGTAKLNAVNYLTGGGTISGARSMDVGVGIASAPIISMNPTGSGTPDLYITVSGGAAMSASTTRANINPPGVANRTNMLYWKDKRLQ